MSSTGSGRAGFGTGQIDYRVQRQDYSDLELAAAAGDTTAVLQLIEQHTRKLAEKYAEAALLTPIQVFIAGAASGFTQRIDLTQSPHNSVIVAVVAGTANLYLGDYSGTPQAANPHLQVGAGSSPQFFWPLEGRIYTIINPSTTVNLLACVIPIAL